MIYDMKEMGDTCTFKMKCDFFTANSVRRSLLSDIETYAPFQINVIENTSCQTDEYIAHRIGLIPFVPTKNLSDDNNTMILNVSERLVKAADIISENPPFTTCMKDAPIIKLIKGQTLNVEVFFNKGTAEKHARYSPIASVGFEITPFHMNFTFSSINGEQPSAHLRKALVSLQNRLNSVKYSVERATSE
jgi:DNA-directed RNA polymerase alpha subunit